VLALDGIEYPGHGDRTRQTCKYHQLRVGSFSEVKKAADAASARMRKERDQGGCEIRILANYDRSCGQYRALCTY